MKYLVFLIPFLIVSCAHKDKKMDAAKGGEKTMKQSAGSKENTPTVSDGPKMTVTCTAGKDERQISKKMTDGGGCEVSYTKHGESNVIADAKNDSSYCDNVMDKIKTNLTNAGFNCQ